MGMAAILFNSANHLNKLIVPHVKSSENGKRFERRRHLKNYTILYMYKVQGQGQISPGAKALIITNKFYCFNHTL